MYDPRYPLTEIAMHIGYARVSTGEQNLDMQIDALKQAGCEKIFTDEMSGAKSERPGLQEALAFVRDGDMLVVWRLDRLGRSLKDLVQKVESLNHGRRLHRFGRLRQLRPGGYTKQKNSVRTKKR